MSAPVIRRSTGFGPVADVTLMAVTSTENFLESVESPAAPGKFARKHVYSIWQ